MSVDSASGVRDLVGSTRKACCYKTLQLRLPAQVPHVEMLPKILLW